MRFRLLIHSDNLLGKPFCPLFLAPRARNLVGNKAVEYNSGRDMDAVLSAEFDWYQRVGLSQLCLCLNWEDSLVYFRSSVTAIPPLGLDFNVRMSRIAPFLSLPMTEAAREASFSLIWMGVRVEVGISK